MLVACDDPTHEALQAMLRRHEVDRRYLALVRGATEHESFTVEPRSTGGGRAVVVHEETGRAAETRFEVRERLGRCTLLEAAPRTGRTHQIRVHLRAIGHPILGDGRYGGGGDDARRLGLDRPFLHSWRLACAHPMTGEGSSGGGAAAGRPRERPRGRPRRPATLTAGRAGRSLGTSRITRL